MKVSNIINKYDHFKVDYLLNIDIKNIRYDHEVKIENKKEKKILDKEHDISISIIKPEYKSKFSCELDISYQLLTGGSKDELISEKTHVSNNKTKEIKFTKISNRDKSTEEFVMDNRIEYIYKTIMKPLHKIVGY